MPSDLAANKPVLVHFPCPACGASNGVNLIALTRAGRTTCTLCDRVLKVTDVMTAMHSPRRARGPEDRPLRASHALAPVARVWPPTRESRAAIAKAER